MELHHKLRRDPSWHPSGCNICGQVGSRQLRHRDIIVACLLYSQKSVHFCTSLASRSAFVDMTAIFIFLQLGHQAINCTNGTINWKQIYGEESFKLKAPIYPSDYDAIKKAKTVDVDKFTKLAQEWRTVPCRPNHPHSHAVTAF